MASQANSGFGFIIKTNSYAGNFERQMCAHLTGCVGDCEVGEEYVEEKITDEFEGSLQWVSNDNGCARPTSIHCNEGNLYNNVVIYFEHKPTADQIKLMKERLETFPAAMKRHKNGTSMGEELEVLGFELEEYNRTVKKISL